MNRRYKKMMEFVAFLTLFTMLMPMLLVGTVNAQPKDIAGHWAEEIINKWEALGLAKGSADHTFKPNDAITRAEFVTFINRIFNFIDKSDETFADVNENAWYADEIAKAFKAGILKGDSKGKINPNEFITRQEAAVILARVFKLQVQDRQASDKFSDAGQIASWAREAVSAMIENGYISGRSGNLIAPLDKITRAESIKMIDNAIGKLINMAGTYNESVDGNLVVNTENVELKDMTIGGNLYITQGVADGTVSLEGVTVKGETFVNGGGEHSIIISNSSLEGTLVVLKVDGKIRIVAAGSSEISRLNLNSGAKLQEQNLTGKGFGNVEVYTVQQGQEIFLDGDFEDLIVDASGASINVTSGTIGNLQISEGAAGTNILISQQASIENFTANASATVTGEGTITSTNINAEDVIIDLSEEAEAHEDSTPPPSTGGSGGGGGSSTVKVSAISVSPETMTLTAGGSTGTITATISPNNATNKNVTWTSSNEAVATVFNGVVTPIAAGTAAITVTTEDGGKTATCEVTVEEASHDIEAELEVIIADDQEIWISVWDKAVDETILGLSKENFSLSNALGSVDFKFNDPSLRDVNVPEHEYLFSPMAGEFTGTYTLSFNNAGYQSTSIEIEIDAEAATGEIVSISFSPNSYTAGIEHIISVTVATYGLVDGTEITLVLVGDSVEDIIVEPVVGAVSSNMAIINMTVPNTVAAGMYYFEAKATGVSPSYQTVTFIAPEQDSEITAVALIDDIIVDYGTILEAVGLPTSVEVTLDDNSTQQLEVNWDDGTPEYNGDISVTYEFEGTLTLEEGIANTAGFTATVKVIVNAEIVAVTGITLDQETMTLTAGGATGTLVATVAPVNATNKNVTWTSSDESVATVSNGVITTVAVGSATITVTTEDGSFTATSEVTVNAVNHSPIANNDTATVNEDSTVLIDVIVNDADTDGDTLSISGFTQGANGTVAQEGDSLRYTPNADYNGADSFTYDISDGNATATATVNITVNAAPVINPEGDLLDSDAGSDFIGVLYTRDGNIYYNQTDVNGNWANETLIGTGTEGRIAVDSLDNIHVAYTTNGKIAYRKYDGNAWSTEELIESNNGGTCSKPDIAADSNGYAHITYTDTKGNTGAYTDKPDIMYATNASGGLINEVIFNGYYEHLYGSCYIGAYYEKGSFITLDNNDNYYIAAHVQDFYKPDMQVAERTYYVTVSSNLGNGSTTTSSSDIFDIYDLTSDGDKVVALYKQSTFKTSELTVSGTTINFTNTADLTGTSVSSVETDGTNVVVGGISSTNLLIQYNGVPQVFSEIVVKGTKVSIAYAGGTFYAVYTDNSDGIIKLAAYSN